MNIIAAPNIFFYYFIVVIVLFEKRKYEFLSQKTIQLVTRANLHSSSLIRMKEKETETCEKRTMCDSFINSHNFIAE